MTSMCQLCQRQSFSEVGLLADWCCWTMEYTCSCLPCRLAGQAVGVKTCCPAACLCWETKNGAFSRLGYEWAASVQSMSSWVSMLGCRSAIRRQISIHSSVVCAGGVVAFFLILQNNNNIRTMMHNSLVRNDVQCEQECGGVVKHVHKLTSVSSLCSMLNMS